MVGRSARSPENPLIFLTGATGYVGGRLRGILESRGRRIRCLARRPEYLSGRVAPRTEVIGGDLLQPGTLPRAMEGVALAYYLVHSLGSAGGFEEEDRRAARNFADAARRSGLRRIIYLGGLGEGREALSPHLRSRQEVGEILRSSGVPVIELRASIVIGSGSFSFEMIRALVERLPVMITPRWVSVPAQPIAITDLLEYLLLAETVPAAAESRILEIGGAEVVSYGELMAEYARQRGLRRTTIPVPVITPRLSSLWLGLVTPLYARVGEKLIDSIRHPTVVRDDAAARIYPVRPRGFREAIAEALANEDRELAETRWSDALSSSGKPRTWGGVRFGTRLVDSRAVRIPLSPPAVFAPVRRIGGAQGWYYGNRLWKVRGLLDLLAGGVGLRRGRRDPERLRPGDTVDCWRVEEYQPDRQLRLAAEMKLPGRAWLDFEVEVNESGSTLRQTAIFDPLGVAGLAYWYLIYPLHHLVFAGMLRNIARAAREAPEDPSFPHQEGGGRPGDRSPSG